MPSKNCGNSLSNMTLHELSIQKDFWWKFRIDPSLKECCEIIISSVEIMDEQSKLLNIIERVSTTISDARYTAESAKQDRAENALSLYVDAANTAKASLKTYSELINKHAALVNVLAVSAANNYAAVNIAIKQTYDSRRNS